MVIVIVLAMKTILAIDVGINNLALCCMSRVNERTNINFWELCNADTPKPTEIFPCSVLNKNGEKCKRKGTYNSKSTILEENETKDIMIVTCTAHSKKYNESTIIAAKKQKGKGKGKRKCKAKDTLQVTTVKVLQMLQEVIDRNITHFNEVNHVAIELQPSINPRMKWVSHIIFGKLCEFYSHSDSVKVTFINASQKLKVNTVKKFIKPDKKYSKANAYKNRKLESVFKCKELLKELNIDHKWLEFFESKSKADDLSDTALYCIRLLDRK